MSKSETSATGFKPSAFLASGNRIRYFETLDSTDAAPVRNPDRDIGVFLSSKSADQSGRIESPMRYKSGPAETFFTFCRKVLVFFDWSQFVTEDGIL